jgi:ketosteroid isomerase-like protein
VLLTKTDDGVSIERMLSSTPPGRKTMQPDLGTKVAAVTLLAAAAVTHANPADDQAKVAALDTEYQAAVKRNDAEAMGRILADDFVLVLGDGRTFNRADLLESARSAEITYEQQDEDQGTQIVRVWGDTAVVTARLWIKGVNKGARFERRLWFSDTYVRTPTGWRYAFGQASLPLPAAASAESKP